MIKDMTEGSPSKILLRFSLPMILSGMFQQMYNVVDSVVAGKFSGVDALAAVGASYPVTMLFIAVATGAGMGSSVVISRLFGAKEYQRMKTAVFTAVSSMLVLSLLLTAVGTLVCSHLMRLLRTPANIFEDSALYLRIYIWGLFFLFLYNMATAVFNGLGDSKIPLGLLIFSSLFNVVLDILFVAGFHWGVAGVAWATFIAQGLSSILAFLILIRRLRSIQTEGGYPKFSWHTLGKIAVIAVPSILQQSIVSVGQLAVQALVNGFGAAVIAGYSAAIKIDSFFKMTIMSMGNAMSSFTAQNMGAGKPERVGPGKKAALLSMLLYAVVSLVLVVFFGQYMIGLFADTSEDAAQVIAVGTQYMLIVSGGYLIYAVLMVYNGILRGAGYMLGFTTVTLTDLICRVGFSYLLAWITQSDASIWWAIPIGWGVGAVLALLFYYKGNWQRA